MTTNNLEDMLVGWQKVATRYALTIYVYELPLGHMPNARWLAVTNERQGVGTLIKTIFSEGPAPRYETASHGRWPREGEVKV